MAIFACLLLAAPFLGAGAGAAWVTRKMFGDAQRADDWVLVKAEVVPGAPGARRGKPGSGHFAYSLGGRTYEGRRLAFGGFTSNDDIDAWRAEFADMLQSARQADRAISVWVDPDNPAESVFDRRRPWHVVIVGGLLAFGAGLSALTAILAALAIARGREAMGRVPIDKGGSGFLWIFALAWNGLSFPMAFFLLPVILEAEEWFGLIILLFPIVGVLLLWFATIGTTSAAKGWVARSARPNPSPAARPGTSAKRNRPRA